MPNQICSVCAAPDEVRKAIEAKLGSVRYRDLQAETGFHRSILHRHYAKHMPQQAIDAHREHRKVNVADKRILVLWASGVYSVQHDPNDPSMAGRRLPADQVTKNDVIVRVAFGGNPTAPVESSNPDNPDELDIFPR